jgi:hypothetical protein
MAPVVLAPVVLGQLAFGAVGRLAVHWSKGQKPGKSYRRAVIGTPHFSAVRVLQSAQMLKLDLQISKNRRVSDATTLTDRRTLRE